MKNTPFVTFYSENNISPVSQDISDLRRHFQRRESLFRSLGIIPSFVEGRRILEFGPGGGHNAVYTASLSPALYHLVDGNAIGVQEARKQLQAFDELNINVFHCLFNDFNCNDEYDLVWAEGCLPHQSDPLGTLEIISRFVAQSGLLCITTANGISYLSEIMRRLFAYRFFNEGDKDIHKRVNKLKPFLEPHLRHLSSMSRPVDDWIIDNIIQPLHDRRLLSIPEVINSLGKKFDIFGTSPNFITDWRWYKSLVGNHCQFNKNALDCYYKNNLNLLDCRQQFACHSVEFGEKLENLAAQSWGFMREIEQGSEISWQDFFNLMEQLCDHIKTLAPNTFAAIREAVVLLKSDNPAMELNYFNEWWGRGQQYMSLIRNI